jgi:predicted O-methyltransferase YrrM
MNDNLTNLLKRLKSYGIAKNIPNVSESEGRFLNMLVKMAKAKNILEIGCANGYSTIWLAEAAAQNHGEIITIDFSRPSFEVAKTNIAEAGFSETVDFHFGDALDIIRTIKNPEKFDLIFIDGEKRSYLAFWDAIKNRLNHGAVVVFDDILAFPDKTAEFTEKIKNMVGFDWMILPIDGNDGVLLLYKQDLRV